MGECQIHEAVFVEVECNNTGRCFWKRRIPWFRLTEGPFARICEDGSGAPPPGKNQIDSAIIVQIRGERRNSWSVPCQSGLGRPIRKRAVPIVAPECVPRRGSPERKVEFAARRNSEICQTRNIKVEVAIVIKIYKGEPK